MADSRFQQLLQLFEQDPNDLFLKYALAMEYLGMNRKEEAASFFRQIIVADLTYVPAYYQLGKLLEQDDETEAIKLYEEGMKQAAAKGDRKTVNEFRSALDELLF